MRDKSKLYDFGVFLPLRDSLDKKWEPLLREYSDYALDPIEVGGKMGVDPRLLPQICFWHGLSDPYRPGYDIEDDALWLAELEHAIERDATMRGFGAQINRHRVSRPEVSPNTDGDRPINTGHDPSGDRPKGSPETDPDPSGDHPLNTDGDRPKVSPVSQKTKTKIERRVRMPVAEFVARANSEGLSLRDMAKIAGVSYQTIKRLKIELDS